MVDLFWQIIVWITSISAFLSTIKLSIYGANKKFSNKLFNIISSPYWLIILIAQIPWAIGAFARGEINPLPWTEYNIEMHKHGIMNGILSVISVLNVELWLFWTPSQIYITNLEEGKMSNSVYIRLLNFAIGIIIVTEMNPLYLLLN